MGRFCFFGKEFQDLEGTVSGGVLFVAVLRGGDILHWGETTPQLPSQQLLLSLLQRQRLSAQEVCPPSCTQVRMNFYSKTDTTSLYSNIADMHKAYQQG